MNTTPAPALNTTPALNTAPALSGSAAGRNRTDHPASQLLKSQEVSTKVAQLMQERTTTALTQINERIREGWQHHAAGTPPQPVAPWDLWTSGAHYAVDFAQRSDLLRHAAPARQQLPRARAAGPAAGAALRVRSW